jgi:hypothetical protein
MTTRAVSAFIRPTQTKLVAPFCCRSLQTPDHHWNMNTVSTASEAVLQSAQSLSNVTVYRQVTLLGANHRDVPRPYRQTSRLFWQLHIITIPAISRHLVLSWVICHQSSFSHSLSNQFNNINYHTMTQEVSGPTVTAESRVRASSFWLTFVLEQWHYDRPFQYFHSCWISGTMTVPFQYFHSCWNSGTMTVPFQYFHSCWNSGTMTVPSSTLMFRYQCQPTNAPHSFTQQSPDIADIDSVVK